MPENATIVIVASTGGQRNYMFDLRAPVGSLLSAEGFALVW